MKSKSESRLRGFTLIECFVVMAIVAVLVLLLLPRFAKSRKPAPRINCINNLKQVGLSFRQWSLDNNDKYPMQVSVTNGGTLELISSGNVFVHFLVMSNELNTPKVLICPQESNPKRQSAATFESSLPAGTSNRIPFTNDYNLSYFVGLDADQTLPMTFLTGDDNLTVAGVRVKRGILSLWSNAPVAWTNDRHVNQGNICLADGSVQALNSKALVQALHAAGLTTNRLAMP